MTQDKELLEEILKAMVTQPEQVEVSRSVDEMGVLLSVKVADEDARVVIGKEGRAIQALRTIMNTVGRRVNARVNIKLLVPELPGRSRSGID